MGGRGVATFLQLYSLVQSHLLCVCVCGGEGEVGSKVSLYYFLDLQSFELAMQDFHPRSH